MKVLSSGLRLRYRYPGILLRAMVITDFGVRYQVSLVGCLLTLVRTLALFTILHIIFMQLLKIGAGVPQMIDSPRPDPHAQKLTSQRLGRSSTLPSSEVGIIGISSTDDRQCFSGLPGMGNLLSQLVSLHEAGIGYKRRRSAYTGLVFAPWRRRAL